VSNAAFHFTMLQLALPITILNSIWFVPRVLTEVPLREIIALALAAPLQYFVNRI